jgi:ribonuclease HI
MEDFAELISSWQPNLVIVADGSGTVAKSACGWAATLYWPDTKAFHRITGGSSVGTNNLAELQPFLHALWYAKHIDCKGHTIRVLCISDSEVTVKCGSGEFARTANGALWAQVEWYESQGIQLYWHWVPRNSNEYNKWADEKAGEVRRMLLLS